MWEWSTLSLKQHVSWAQKNRYLLKARLFDFLISMFFMGVFVLI